MHIGLTCLANKPISGCTVCTETLTFTVLVCKSHSYNTIVYRMFKNGDDYTKVDVNCRRTSTWEVSTVIDFMLKR